MSTAEREAAAQRVRAYLAELSTMHGVHQEQIHGLHEGHEREVLLLASDLAALAAPAPQPEAQAVEARTVAATWRQQGEPDPHAGQYDCERAALTLGYLTDDELANGAFLNYDRRLDLSALSAGKPGYHSPIVWMTAVKDRIRWLSRALESARAAPAPARRPLLLGAWTTNGSGV